MYTFQYLKNQNETIFSNILKCDTSSEYKKVKIDHYLDSLEKFHQQYITMPTEPYSSYYCDESIYIHVITPQGFMNQ